MTETAAELVGPAKPVGLEGVAAPLKEEPAAECAGSPSAEACSVCPAPVEKVIAGREGGLRGSSLSDGSASLVSAVSDGPFTWPEYLLALFELIGFRGGFAPFEFDILNACGI